MYNILILRWEIISVNVLHSSINCKYCFFYVLMHVVGIYVFINVYEVLGCRFIFIDLLDYLYKTLKKRKYFSNSCLISNTYFIYNIYMYYGTIQLKNTMKKFLSKINIYIYTD